MCKIVRGQLLSASGLRMRRSNLDTISYLAEISGPVSDNVQGLERVLRGVVSGAKQGSCPRKWLRHSAG